MKVLVPLSQSFKFVFILKYFNDQIMWKPTMTATRISSETY